MYTCGVDLLIEIPELDGYTKNRGFYDWVDYFTSWQCHALAMTLADITGYDMYVFSDKDEEEYLYGDSYACCHAFVMTPNGDVFDVNGVNDFGDYWASDQWSGMDEVFQVNSFDFDHWDEPDFYAAEHVARWLVKNFF